MAEVLQGQAIAIVETKPSRNDYVDLFENSFEFDQFQLCSNPSVKRVLKRDVDIEFNPDDYDWVILVGSEPLKFYTKEGSITEYSGRIVDDKFLPIINPAMLAFKPEAKKTWDESRDNIFKYMNNELKQEKLENIYGITESADLHVFLTKAIEHENDFVALDSETSALYPRNGHMLGISLSYEPEHGAYIDCNCIDEKAEELLQLLFDKKRVVFHNAKFDIAFFEYHFGFKFPRFEDTMLMHYMLEEQPGTHGLKQLTLRYTPYGDYEKPMYQWIEEFRKRTGILKDSFSWDMIPFDIMKDYAAMDAVCTPNSTVQLRGLLFDFLQLTPTGKKTGTGANSTDAEVLGKLAEVHEIPRLVLDIRQKVKIKSTYLDKIYPQLDKDSRLRTNFNLHGTTSLLN